MLLLPYYPPSDSLQLQELEAKCNELTKVTRFVDNTLRRMVDAHAPLQELVIKLADMAEAVHVSQASVLRSSDRITVYVGEETFTLRNLLDSPFPSLTSLESAQAKAYYRKLAKHYHPNANSVTSDVDMYRLVKRAYQSGSLETLHLLARRAGLVVSGSVEMPSYDSLIKATQRKLSHLQATASYRITAQYVTGPIGAVKAALSLDRALRDAHRLLVLTLTKSGSHEQLQ